MIKPTGITKPETINSNLTGIADSDGIVSSDDAPTSASVDNRSGSEYSDFDDSHLRKIRALRAITPATKNPQGLPTPSPSPHQSVPTRVQPSRAVKRTTRVQPSGAVKRKAQAPLLPPAPTQTPSAKRRKITLIIKRPSPEPKTEETKGDYTLSKLDLKESQPDYADRGDMADGMDVAYFMIGVEKAVHAAVSELVASRMVNGVLSFNSPRTTSTTGIRARWRRLNSFSTAGPAPVLKEEESKDEESFEPAGDPVPGEDWRPLVPTPRSTPRQGTGAPIAPMQISPSLGRWQIPDRRATDSFGQNNYEELKVGDMPKLKLGIDSKAAAVVEESIEESIEEPDKKTVEVSGLKFDVELRSLGHGQDLEATREVWFHML